MTLNLLALVAKLLNRGLVRAQTGRVRSYATAMVFGAAVILLALVMLPGGVG